MAPFRADDRVLLLAIPSRADLAAIARVLMNGVLVALGTRDEVDQARRSMADFDNVMFLDASPEQIPWREAYFTKILVPPHMESLLSLIATELHRVLAPGGEILHTGVNA
ncbi:MAG TPA: hypothetical protein VLJ11_13335 [Bryobacteraceae bacterium]|nr:hypothetical protein [Bryobacteraceae bacterium]